MKVRWQVISNIIAHNRIHYVIQSPQDLRKRIFGSSHEIEATINFKLSV